MRPFCFLLDTVMSSGVPQPGLGGRPFRVRVGGGVKLSNWKRTLLTLEARVYWSQAGSWCRHCDWTKHPGFPLPPGTTGCVEVGRGGARQRRSWSSNQFSPITITHLSTRIVRKRERERSQRERERDSK